MISWANRVLAAPTGGGDDYWAARPVVADRAVDPRPDVLVVGGGIAGAATAYACARRGLSVQVIDRDRAAGGVTCRSAGALVPEVHVGRVPTLVTTLNRRGLVLHRKLAADLGHQLRRLDWLDLRPDGPTAPDGSLADARQLVPGLAASAQGRLVTDQAQVDPVEVTASLLHQVPVGAGIEAGECRDTARGLEVRTNAGTIRPGWLVVATGQLPRPVADRPQGVRGHLIALDTPPDVLPPRTAIGERLTVLPSLYGGLIAGATRDGSTPAGHPLRDVVDGIRRQLAALLPDTRGAPVQAAWVGFRPTVGDRLPVVGRLPMNARCVLIGGLYHTGVLLAPAIAELVVAAITEDRDLPAALRCDRPLD